MPGVTPEATFTILLMATGAEAEAFLAICGRYGVSQAVIAEVRARARAITTSAMQPSSTPPATWPRSPAPWSA